MKTTRLIYFLCILPNGIASYSSQFREIYVFEDEETPSNQSFDSITNPSFTSPIPKTAEQEERERQFNKTLVRAWVFYDSNSKRLFTKK